MCHSAQSKCTSSARETSMKLGNKRKSHSKSPPLQHRRPPRTSLRIQRTQRSLSQAHSRSLSLVSAPAYQEPLPIKSHNFSLAPLQSVGPCRHRQSRYHRATQGHPLKNIPQHEARLSAAPKEQDKRASSARTFLRGSPWMARTDRSAMSTGTRFERPRCRTSEYAYHT